MSIFHAIVVDDEPLARSRLKRLLDSVEDITVVAQGENGQEAIELVKKYQPELLLLDIAMPVMNGLQAAREIIRLAKPPAIVFCTAYDQYAIQAFKAQATAYLLKPIMLEDLQQAIAQASQLNQLQLNSLFETQEGGATISIQHQNYIEKKPLQDIAYFRSQDKQVIAGNSEGTEIIIDYTLKSLESEFNDSLVRVHRNALINKSYLTKLHRSDNQVWVVLTGGHEFAVSRRHLSEVKHCFI